MELSTVGRRLVSYLVVGGILSMGGWPGMGGVELRRVGNGSERRAAALGGGVRWSCRGWGVLGRERGNAGAGKEDAKSREKTSYLRRTRTCSDEAKNATLPKFAGARDLAENAGRMEKI